MVRIRLHTLAGPRWVDGAIIPADADLLDIATERFAYIFKDKGELDEMLFLGVTEGRQLFMLGFPTPSPELKIRVYAAWSGFPAFIGAGAFALGMAIHNEATAKPPAPRPEPIYYCATGEEIPLYQPCKDRKDQLDI